MNIELGSPVLTPDGFAVVIHLHSDIAGSREWRVKLNNGIERWYAEKNLTLLIPETRKAERDALAAHLKRLRPIINYGLRAARSRNDKRSLEWTNILADEPESSLAHRDAKKQAEAIIEFGLLYGPETEVRADSQRVAAELKEKKHD